MSGKTIFHCGSAAVTPKCPRRSNFVCVSGVFGFPAPRGEKSHVLSVFFGGGCRAPLRLRLVTHGSAAATPPCRILTGLFCFAIRRLPRLARRSLSHVPLVHSFVLFPRKTRHTSEWLRKNGYRLCRRPPRLVRSAERLRYPPAKSRGRKHLFAENRRGIIDKSL